MTSSSKVHPESAKLVNNYIESLPQWSKDICNKLREIILSTSQSISEDWKWNHPNYYCNGMLCGIWAFKDHVTLVFFQGALIDDKYSILSSNPENLHNRHIKFSDISQINPQIIRDYLLQSVDNNTKGLKINQTKIKTIEIPYYIKEALENAGLLESFNNLSYSHKKEYILWIKEAKKEDTKNRRIEKMIIALRDKFGMSHL
ncbi:MAG: DUF1801 domain-containing protein [Bacteroidia bacterium]|nr:DUF1801 domain-containing protein [Bacteroidia bacterium]